MARTSQEDEQRILVKVLSAPGIDGPGLEGGPQVRTQPVQRPGSRPLVIPGHGRPHWPDVMLCREAPGRPEVWPIGAQHPRR